MKPTPIVTIAERIKRLLLHHCIAYLRVVVEKEKPALRIRILHRAAVRQ